MENFFRKVKLDGKRLVPSLLVEYLGVHLAEHLHLTKQLNHVKRKPDRAIGILSKIKYNSNLEILKIRYHSLLTFIVWLPTLGTKNVLHQLTKFSFFKIKLEEKLLLTNFTIQFMQFIMNSVSLNFKT